MDHCFQTFSSFVNEASGASVTRSHGPAVSMQHPPYLWKYCTLVSSSTKMLPVVVFYYNSFAIEINSTFVNFLGVSWKLKLIDGSINRVTLCKWISYSHAEKSLNSSFTSSSLNLQFSPKYRYPTHAHKRSTTSIRKSSQIHNQKLQIVYSWFPPKPTVH